MLVLTRATDEEVVITVPPGDRARVVRVMVVAVADGRRVRLGFEAEKDIEVDRSEIRDKKDRNKKGGHK